MKTEQRYNSCVIDSDHLDDWLESDLRQSGILPTDNNMNVLVKHKEEDSSEASDDKTIISENEMDVPTPPLTSILKALATLNSLYQQGNSLPSHHVPGPPSPLLSIPNAINPLRMTKAHATLTKRNNVNISSRPTKQDIMITTPSTAKKRQQESTDTLDPVTLKRSKNTDAARRSRQRKVMKMEGLESRVSELEKQNEQLLLRVTEAERIRDEAKLKESSRREKMMALEAEWALAQKVQGSHATSNHIER